MAALIQQGDEVIIPAPYWVTFYDVVKFHGGKPVIVQTSEDEGFRLSAGDIEKALTDRTKLVIVNSPSNPSGAVVSPEEFEKIYSLVAARGAMLLADECYSHFIYNGDPFSIASVKGSKPNLVVAGSMSKDLRDDRMAARLCTRTGPADIRDQQAAKATRPRTQRPSRKRRPSRGSPARRTPSRKCSPNTASAATT